MNLTRHSAKNGTEFSVFCRRERWGKRIYVDMTTVEHNSKDPKQLDLTSALRIIQNAGLPDPMLQSGDPIDQVQSIIDALCRLSTHDGLTGLVNALSFHAILSREINRSLRTGRACGLMVFDLDHFKLVNDTYGHAAGDKALQAVAEQMKIRKRSMDTAARIGGEEFAIVLPECSPEDAIAAATRIHSRLNPIIVNLGECALRLTSSAGLVWTNPNIPASSASLLAEADDEMYRAKRSGRQRLCYKAPESTMVSGQEQSALMSLRLGDSMHEN
jgi:diguanylate cyclase (GGDEF)-like protein